MGVVRPVRIGVVKAVDRDPFDRSVLVSQAAEEGQQIFQRFPELEGAMCQQSVITEADPQPSRQPLEQHEDPEGWPVEGQNASDDRYEVNRREADEAAPFDLEPGERILFYHSR